MCHIVALIVCLCATIIGNQLSLAIRSLDSIIASSIESVQVIKQAAFNGVNPDHNTLLSTARAIYRGLVQQVSATGIDVVPITHPSGGLLYGHNGVYFHADADDTLWTSLLPGTVSLELQVGCTFSISSDF